MILGIHVEVLLAVSYGFLLMAVALALEALARRSQKRTENYHNSGFIYFGGLDYWECPAGQQLVQIKTDHQKQIKFYRAPASACNSCALKLNCTDSNEGRLLESRLDTWIQSGLRHFHRGISLALLLLATVLLLVETFRYSQLHDREVLAAMLLLLGLAQTRLWPSMRHRREPTLIEHRS